LYSILHLIIRFYLSSKAKLGIVGVLSLGNQRVYTNNVYLLYISIVQTFVNIIRIIENNIVLICCWNI